MPGENVKPVYTAALRLKMDRVAAECARFLASHLDLGSCLEIRSTPGVTNKIKTKPENDEVKTKNKERKSSKDSNKNGSNHSENGDPEPGKEGPGEIPENGARAAAGAGAGAAETEENGEDSEEHVDLVNRHFYFYILGL